MFLEFGLIVYTVNKITGTLKEEEENKEIYEQIK